MKPQRGYFSLIQFCPDPSRMEAVNVGLVLFCPAIGFLGARTSRSNRRAEKLVGREKLQRAALDAAKKAIETRLEIDRASFENIEDFERFINSRGNWLKLTPPRPVKVFDPPQELEKLFGELVSGRSLRQRRTDQRKRFPALDAAFKRLSEEGRAQLDFPVRIPVLEEPLDVPYAYANGKLNLVKPHLFSGRKQSSIPAAMRLAVEGDLVNRHGIDDRKANLIVVASFEDAGDVDLHKRVRTLFDEYRVQNFGEDQIEAFIAEVEQQAH